MWYWRNSLAFPQDRRPIGNWVLGLLGASGVLGASIGAAATHYQIRVNGAYLSPDVAPVLVNGRLMVSARWVAEALGANVSYESSDHTAVIQSPNKSPGLTVTAAEMSGGSITGTIVNQGSQTAQSVTVTATLWSSSGTVIGQPSAPVPSSLTPGTSATFSIPLSGAQITQTAAFEVAGGTAAGNVGDTLNGTEWANDSSLNTEPVAVTLNSVSTPASIPGSLGVDTPPTGDEYVEVNVTVQNNGTVSADFYGQNELYIQDSSGNRYTPDIMASDDAGGSAGEIGGTVSPTQKMAGVAVFDVPTGATGLQLVWDSGTENQVFWNLGLQ